ncbi:hypothetical protein JQX13_08415 [Archangium violaceum]|uniref:hypothetical protein n=1 Tax=Archangium violaceum TaxID=83451 RepID=UPI00193C2B9A|nr:hypothetical protein [Archangium violaceum]QRK10106.1 hypothetical protein JQX13_08415 [Archangium violaceum]
MSTVFAVVCFLIALAPSLTPPSAAFFHLSTEAGPLLVAPLPFVLTLWVSWRQFLSDRPWEEVPLGWGLPLLASVACAGIAFFKPLVIHSIEIRRAKAQRAKELAALRAEVEHGCLRSPVTWC